MSAAMATDTKTASKGRIRRIRRIMLLLEECPQPGSPFNTSLAHYLNNDAFRTLSVEFRVINLLPRAKIEPALRHRNNHLVMHDQTFQVGIAIRFARAVMAVILAERRQFLQPFVDVGQQPVFGVVHPDAGRNVHGRNQDHSFANPAFLKRGIHFGCDVDILSVLLGLELQILGVKSHRPIIPRPPCLTLSGPCIRLESAIKERAGWPPESSSWLCWQPASLRRRTSLILARGSSRNLLTKLRPYSAGRLRSACTISPAHSRLRRRRLFLPRPIPRNPCTRDRPSLAAAVISRQEQRAL